jgi:hypothetical protein
MASARIDSGRGVAPNQPVGRSRTAAAGFADFSIFRTNRATIGRNSGRLEALNAPEFGRATRNRSSLTELADPAPSGVARENFASFEAYFSNYIEGTTFTVEEAEDIVSNGQIVENRSEALSHHREAQSLVAALSRISRRVQTGRLAM